ncbi:type IV pilus modification protein PilV [Neisseria sp. HSC-16F19]|nr:type IV pilus modification protein PilV [Neisseria sp. HSC-16F19]MCP2040298.1 type IV pilus modification protein PilV [Neisseria sp. HSC-16F19]
MIKISTTSSPKRSQQQGATLIEALVAIFVLAFGVLALMAAQLRSVVSIQEAENQTIVATAAQTLMEGMLANPDLSIGTTPGQTVRTYERYKKGNLVTFCATAAVNTTYDTSALSKDQLAEYQLCSFHQQVANKLTNAVIDNVQVSESGGIYSINVAWKMQAGDSTTNQGTVSAGSMRYSYTLPVQN